MPKSMEERLLELEDRDAIAELIALYAWYVPRYETDAMADLFTEDGTFMTIHGRKEIAAYFKAHLRPNGTVPLVSNIQVTLNGDEATSVCKMTTPWASTQPGFKSFTGIYNDTLRRTPDGWRFVKRMFSYHTQPQS